MHVFDYMARMPRSLKYLYFAVFVISESDCKISLKYKDLKMVFQLYYSMPHILQSQQYAIPTFFKE